MATLFEKKVKKPTSVGVGYFALMALALLPGCLFAGRKIEVRKGDVVASYESSWIAGDVDTEAEYDPVTGKWRFKWTSKSNLDAAAQVRIKEAETTMGVLKLAEEAIKKAPIPTP